MTCNPFKVYGIRLMGELEARYIGQTVGRGGWRLHNTLTAAKAMPRKTLFADWLIANADRLEAFDIAAVETRQMARVREREVIETCLALGHRLFNRQHVPRAIRLPLRDEPLRQAA